MTRIEYPPYQSHFYLLTYFYGSTGTKPEALLCLLDTGATKCVIPKSTNDNTLKLPIASHDNDVGVAQGTKSYDVVIVPKIALLNVEIRTDDPSSFTLHETDLMEENVEAWLGDVPTLGMNFICKFDMHHQRNGNLIFER